MTNWNSWTSDTRTFFSKDEAERIAATIGKDDPVWKYVPNHDPKGMGYSTIKIYDEDGVFVAYL